jgi:hypothetical protein
MYKQRGRYYNVKSQRLWKCDWLRMARVTSAVENPFRQSFDKLPSGSGKRLILTPPLTST